MERNNGELAAVHEEAAQEGQVCNQITHEEVLRFNQLVADGKPITQEAIDILAKHPELISIVI